MNQGKEEQFIKQVMKLFLLLTVVVISCNPKKVVEIETGVPLPVGATKISSTTVGLLMSSASIGNAMKIKHNKIFYDVVLNNEEKVRYVSTHDNRFKTSDGIKIGQSYKQIKKKMTSEWPEPGFAYCGVGGSGWTVAFTDDNFLKTRNISDTSKVKFFFKRMN